MWVFVCGGGGVCVGVHVRIRCGCGVCVWGVCRGVWVLCEHTPWVLSCARKERKRFGGLNG